ISWKFYPKVFEDYLKFKREFGDVSVVLTPLFFYGMKHGDEATNNIAKGKTLLIRLLSIRPGDGYSKSTRFCKLNGQTDTVEIQERSAKVEHKENKKINKANEKQIGAPLQGMLSRLLVKPEEKIRKNQPLFIIEAMKMETVITAPFEGSVAHIELPVGTLVNTN